MGVAVGGGGWREEAFGTGWLGPLGGGWQAIGWVEPGGGGEESLFIFPPKVNYGAKFGRMKKRKEKKKEKEKEKNNKIMEMKK